MNSLRMSEKDNEPDDLIAITFLSVAPPRT